MHITFTSQQRHPDRGTHRRGALNWDLTDLSPFNTSLASVVQPPDVVRPAVARSGSGSGDDSPIAIASASFLQPLCGPQQAVSSSSVPPMNSLAVPQRSRSRRRLRPQHPQHVAIPAGIRHEGRAPEHAHVGGTTRTTRPPARSASAPFSACSSSSTSRLTAGKGYKHGATGR